MYLSVTLPQINHAKTILLLYTPPNIDTRYHKVISIQGLGLFGGRMPR
jgi:hypothetical protein